MTIAPPLTSTLGLNLLYVHSDFIGYGRLGVRLAAELERMGITVTDTLDESEPTHNVACWISVPSHATGWHKDQHLVLFSMWESATLPEPFREGLDNFAQVLVPSQQNVELFSRYHDNVSKIPLGIDTEDWKFRARKPPTDTFRFLTGGSGTRKGVDLSFKAFRKVFKTWPSDMPRPVLQLKTPKPPEMMGERVEHITGYISAADEIALYGAAHCYLQPSRGEGWGLQPLQAIAQGMPTILTDAHGQAEFAHLGLPISATLQPADFFMAGPAGDWWEPSLDELCERMEWVYYHYEEACETAAEASVTAHETFTWSNTANLFLDAIGRERMRAGYTGDGTWTKPVYRRYPVRVVKHWAAEIAGIHYQWEPGKTYWENADTKRVLYESKVLATDCVLLNPQGEVVPEESGMSEKELAGFGDYSASMSYCHHCGQRLGSGELYQP